MKHKDNYKEGKMHDEIMKSLHCMKEIIREMVDSQDRMSWIDEDNHIDRVYEKAYTYDKIIESIKLYFPKVLKEIEK